MCILRTYTDALKQSTGLKEVMKSVLAIGNAMNGVASAPYNTRSSVASGEIKAFKLSSLLKLSQTKSTDGSATVMDYLLQVHDVTCLSDISNILLSYYFIDHYIQLLHERFQSAQEAVEVSGGESAISKKEKAFLAFHVDEELASIHPCCKLNVIDLKNEARSLENELQNLQDLLNAMKTANGTVSESDRFHKKNSFIENFEAKLDTMKADHKMLQKDALEPCLEKCKDICMYFGECNATYSPQNMFEILSTFIKNFNSIKKKLLMAAKKAKMKPKEK